jgi:hypothetical protein
MAIKPVLCLSFKKFKDEKTRSSFTDPRTCTMAMCANLMYLGKAFEKDGFALSSRQIFINGFIMTILGPLPIGGNSIIAAELGIMATLNSGCLDSNRYLSTTGGINLFSTP